MGLLLAGQSSMFPSQLVSVMGAGWLQTAQEAYIMKIMILLCRASDKLQELCQVLVALKRYCVAHLVSDSGGFKIELQKLCSLAAIGDADTQKVAEIHTMKEELLTPGTESTPASRFQKALVIFPTGIALCAMVDREVYHIEALKMLEIT